MRLRSRNKTRATCAYPWIIYLRFIGGTGRPSSRAWLAALILSHRTPGTAGLHLFGMRFCVTAAAGTPPAKRLPPSAAATAPEASPPPAGCCGMPRNGCKTKMDVNTSAPLTTSHEGPALRQAPCSFMQIASKWASLGQHTPLFFLAALLHPWQSNRTTLLSCRLAASLAKQPHHSSFVPLRRIPGKAAAASARAKVHSRNHISGWTSLPIPPPGDNRRLQATS